jgi:hypothetical protein
MSDLLFMCWRVKLTEPANEFSQLFILSVFLKIYFNIRIPDYPEESGRAVA